MELILLDVNPTYDKKTTIRNKHSLSICVGMEMRKAMLIEVIQI